jgi:Repeat of unknown function (DUF5907)
MTVPFTRSLPYVLREQIQQEWAELLVAQVVSVPDAKHVRVSLQGNQVTIPRISTYMPTVGEPCHCLAEHGMLVAIGAVGGVAGGQGPQGPPGPAGTPGEVWYTGSGAPAGSTGIVGDWYLDSASGDFYEKTGASAWTLRGNLKGPQGPQGIQGATGSQGPQGTAGAQGPAGTPGEVWFSSAGAPAGATGAVGDWHLNTSTGDVSEKTGASTWTVSGNIKGPQGAQGNPGPGVATGGTAGQLLAKKTTTNYDTEWVSPSGVPEASPTTKGIVQLAGDLSGTAGSPQIAPGVIVNADVAAAAAIAGSKLADGGITAAKLAAGIVLELAVAGATRKVAFGGGTGVYPGGSSLSNPLTINHGLGVTPIVIFGMSTDIGRGAWIELAGQSNASQLFLRQAYPFGQPAGGTTFGLVWLAIG